MTNEFSYFSLIIPWKHGNIQREESFRNLLKCIESQDQNGVVDPIGFEVIVIEQVNENNCAYAEQRFKELLPATFIGNIKFQYVQVKWESKTFNKSWCMNVAARRAQYNNLLFLDADTLCGADYLKVIRNHLRGTPPTHSRVMVAWNYLIGLPGKDNPIARHIRPDMVRTLGGVFYAFKPFYFDILGGMNENFEGYGGEDNEAYERACVALKLTSLSWMAYPLAHQYHDWEVPHPGVVGYFEIGRKHSKEVSKRLVEAELGNPNHPTFIKLEDLK